VRGAAAGGPGERGRRRLHLRAQAVALERLAVVGEAIEDAGVGVEEHRQQLDALDHQAHVGELGRRLRGGPARERGALVGPADEQLGLGERERGRRLGGRVGQPLVGKREVLDRQRRVGLGGGQAGVEVQRRAQVGRRRLLQRTLQVDQRVLGPAAADRLAGGRAQQLDRRGVAAARRRHELGGDLLVGGVGGGEHGGGAAVLELALAGRDVEVDGVAHERVHEAERGVGPQDVGTRQVAGRTRDGVLGEPGERGDHRQLGALAEHRHGARDRGGLLVQAREAQQHGAGDRARADAADGRGTRGRRPHPVLVQRRQHVPEQQRVATRGLQAGGDEAGVGVAEPVVDEVRDRRFAERGRPHRLGQRVGGDLGEQLRVRARVGRAHARRDEHRRAFEPGGEIRDEAQRRPVAPLQVVDRDQHRPLVGQVERGPVQAVQDRERALGVALGRPEHALGGRRRAGQQTAALVGVARERLEQLAHRAERELALELAAAGGEHGHPVGALARRRQQAALADPRRPLDQHHRAARVARPVEQPLERRDLALALEQAGIDLHVGRMVCLRPGAGLHVDRAAVVAAAGLSATVLTLRAAHAQGGRVLGGVLETGAVADLHRRAAEEGGRDRVHEVAGDDVAAARRVLRLVADGRVVGAGGGRHRRYQRRGAEAEAECSCFQGVLLERRVRCSRYRHGRRGGPRSRRIRASVLDPNLSGGGRRHRRDQPAPTGVRQFDP
jgi:hypothetical protein